MPAHPSANPPGALGLTMRGTTILASALVAALSAAAASAADPATCALPAVLDRRATPTSACTTCHDGSAGLAAHRGHPVDVKYPDWSPDLRRDPEKFNPAIVLAAGTITCMTCHDPKSTLLDHVAAPTSGDVDKRLCVACHPF